jgi:hypothetical protein
MSTIQKIDSFVNKENRINKKYIFPGQKRKDWIYSKEKKFGFFSQSTFQTDV